MGQGDLELALADTIARVAECLDLRRIEVFDRGTVEWISEDDDTLEME
jgi:hypothetical protein